MTQEEFVKESERDLTWCEANATEYLINLPKLINKWTVLSHKEARDVIKLEKRLAETYQANYSFYKNEFDIVLSDKEIQKHIETTTEYVAIKAALDICRQKATLYEGVAKNLNSMRFDIKNTLEWRKFLEGED